MSEPFSITPLSVTIDHSGDEPQLLINGTNYARNIQHGSVTAVTAPASTSVPHPKAKVTLTFIVDDLRILSPDAASDSPMVERICGGVR